MLSKVRRVSN
ncbi:hypothetical protein PENPOL_c015G10085 [Penicillium polonicum]|uniref:Uncharacterized protein n=1 Tax=Penicillium polonicum TaxID=60169 RepID=A0A1V6NB72_PENPO|nr:hypothetical protein PENPOL_c015G10085 [Penicillium polonicum]